MKEKKKIVYKRFLLLNIAYYIFLSKNCNPQVHHLFSCIFPLKTEIPQVSHLGGRRFNPPPHAPPPSSSRKWGVHYVSYYYDIWFD